MCGANKRFFLYLLLALLLTSVVGVLRAEEPGPWYLISETELQIIEEYKTKSEAEKQTWLSQVQELKTQVTGLRKESKTLNNQLADQREQTRMLQRSFNEYEAENLTAISSKNGEIAELKQEVADKTLEAATYKGKAALRLVIIISLLAAIAGYTTFKVLRFFRVIPV